RHGFGPIKDHLLGVTFVTGDGRMVQSGGRVMKNVAGYDLTRLQAGGFGAFGVIVLVHLRLRTLPRADVTYVLEGAREDLTQVGEDIAAAGLTPAALELVSPALARRERWVLAVRLAGSPALVAADEAGLGAACSGCAVPSPASRCRSPSNARPVRCVAPSVTSGRTVRAWVRSSPACAARSIPEVRSSSPQKAHDARRFRRAGRMRALRVLPSSLSDLSRHRR